MSIPASDLSTIREVIADFLEQCDIPYTKDVPLDTSFRDACYADAIRRGFDMNLMTRPLEVGIEIVDTSYRHLENQSTRVFIAVWTALNVSVDDDYLSYADGLAEFFERFLRQEPQRYPVLDHIVTMFREVPQHWGTVTANFIITTQLEFLTSSIIDKVTEGMEVDGNLAPLYPQFTRRMGGVSRAYAVFGFPPHIDLTTWIQVLPDMIAYIDHSNDLLSFYKEEVKNEPVNFISIRARSRGITKIEALRELATETAESYQRASQLLKSTPKAWAAFRSTCIGYVDFHALSPRYQLDELDL